MSSLVIDLPDDAAFVLGTRREKRAQELRMAAAVKLYELERLSAGAAARLAGIPKAVFLVRLADYGVDTFRLSKEELEQKTPLA
ncbi:MAG: UPF0175 family protein [Kiritimatiellae bacterium]|nr:UPF0175 family protein [Kiritimatiellia bacterium]